MYGLIELNTIAWGFCMSFHSYHCMKYWIKTVSCFLTFFNFFKKILTLENIRILLQELR